MAAQPAHGRSGARSFLPASGQREVQPAPSAPVPEAQRGKLLTCAWPRGIVEPEIRAQPFCQGCPVKTSPFGQNRGNMAER